MLLPLHLNLQKFTGHRPEKQAWEYVKEREEKKEIVPKNDWSAIALLMFGDK